MMTPEQSARLLAIAGTYDTRLTPPSKADAQARAVAWSKALDAPMPVEFAIDAIITHYANETQSIMPAHLNRIWRTHRRADAERAATARIIDAPEGIPMPAEIRRQLDQILGRASTG
jgi:hypothetical protein